MKSIKNPLVSLFAAIGLTFGAAAWAQGPAPEGSNYEPPAPAGPGAQQEVNVSDEEVDAFVAAYIAVQTINQEYTEKLQAAESPEDATELQQQAQGEMQQAVTDSGISIEEYQQIANLANQDEGLRDRITEALAAQIEG
ncbi:DUF4168 domain-containing protein [Marinimicrobium alkaliphilum]|uniref:DUF4168 domain-containing protein n=1 Tax=Marinimicrobium alkaliphilum TaxID=2202654 RepID=UPI000DBA8588|nr:DUF4168 domain-containing protein [Marinimicrobium alkaliphilum]